MPITSLLNRLQRIRRQSLLRAKGFRLLAALNGTPRNSGVVASRLTTKPLKNLKLLAMLALTAPMLILSGCDTPPTNTGLEAVYDGERYRIRLYKKDNQQRLEVSDHTLDRVVISADTANLLGAYQTDLSFTESHASFQHHTDTRARCEQTIIDKAEPTSHYFLIAGTFKSPDCPLRFSLRFTEKEQRLTLTATTSDNSYNHLKLTVDADREEAILGFGAQVSRQNFKGIEVPVWIQEQGIGRGAQPLSTIIDANVAGAAGHELSSYFTVPHFLSSAGHTWFLNNSNFSRFDFRNRQKLQIHNYSPTLRAQFSSCAQLLDCTSAYTQFSGRMKSLPTWTHKGAIVGLQGGSETVLQRYRALKDAGTPIAGLWLQDWVGRRLTMGGTASQLWWNWQRDEQLYPEWDALAATLAQDEVKLLGYFNPFLVDVDEKNTTSKKTGEDEQTQTDDAKPTSIKPPAHRADRRNLYQEALAKDFLVKDPSGTPYQIDITDFAAGLVDITNPKAFEWLKEIIKHQVSLNQFSGWMADFGEALPVTAQLASGEDPLQSHNLFPQEWARLNAEVVQELKREDEAVFFMRAGFSQSPSYASLFWLGDQNTSWDHHDGLQSAVIGLLNSGISGQSLNHADIGGYTSLRRPIPQPVSWLLPDDLTLTMELDGESVPQMALHRPQNLLMRWAEMSAFTAVFRTHEGLTPDVNSQVYDNDVTRAHFARNAQLFQALSLYRQHLMKQAEHQGWPLVRHPLLHYPQYAQLLAPAPQDLQFMLGDNLMVAPMLTPKNQRTSRSVFLPEGTWFDLLTNETLEVGPTGKRMRVTPPMGQAPAYVRLNEQSQALIMTPLRDAGFVQ